MMRILLLALFGFFTIANDSIADVPNYSVNKEKSVIKFIAIQNGAPLEGKFKDYTAAIKFDSNDLKQSSVEIEIKTASVEVTYDEVAQNIKMPDWLSTEQFPTATFKSKTLSRMPNTDNYYAEGELTLRNKTLPIIVNFQLDQSNDKIALAKGYATLLRNDFGVGQGEWAKTDTIKNEVRVEFRIVAQKQ